MQQLCPATDQRGYTSGASATCDAGAVQTSGSPLLALTVQATGPGWRQAGDTVPVSYQVTNDSGGTVTTVGIADPAVTDVTCPVPSLDANTSETCTGSYTVTSADAAAGRLTDTAAAYAVTGAGTPAGSADVTVTVPEDWLPSTVAAVYHLTAGWAQGYYLGTSGSPWDSAWTLEVTHPGTGKLTFTDTVTINAGRFTRLTPVRLANGNSARITRGKTLSFSIASHGGVNGMRFATTAAATSITFTLNQDGSPVSSDAIYLGGQAAPASSGSPITFTR